MQTFLTGGTIITPDEVFEYYDLIVDGEKIVDVAPSRPHDNRLEENIIDMTGLFVVPGFIDVHVHGAVGFDTMDATSEAIFRMGDDFARHGVTAFLPTTVAACARDIRAAIYDGRSASGYSFGGALCES